jgi:glucokinase
LYLGIDVGGTKIQMALYDGEKLQIMPKVPTPANYEEFLQVVRVPVAGKITTIGVGLPGTFSDEKVLWVPNIPCLENHDLRGDLGKCFGAEVLLANDAQLALLGEVWQGAGKGKRNAVLMSIGTGIGGAIMVEDKLIRGRRGAAGALGWLNLDHTHANDINHGYLELHASGKALDQMLPPLTGYEIVKRAKTGNIECLQVMNKVGHLVGTAFASIASVLDTEILIVSGGLGSEFDLFEPAILTSFRKYAAPGVSDIPIVKSTLGNLAGVYGAIRLAMG